MIVETAFFRLPQLLTGNYSHRDTFEKTVVQLFAASIQMELAAFNVPLPPTNVYMEKPYPTIARDKRAIHADLYVDLEGTSFTGGRMEAYGGREAVWIEAKGYFGATRGRTRPAKTANVGQVVRDLLRVCLLPEEYQGPIRHNARYLLLVSDEPFSSYLAAQARPWVERLFSCRADKINVTLSREPDTLKSAIGEGFRGTSDLSLEVSFTTHVFAPEHGTSRPLFWGYLVRIRGTVISLGRNRVSLAEKPGLRMEAQDIQRLHAMRSEFVGRMTKARRLEAPA